jgi:hypothetical protein
MMTRKGTLSHIETGVTVSGGTLRPGRGVNDVIKVFHLRLHNKRMKPS